MPRTRGKTRIQLWLALFLVLPISSLSYAWYVISDLPERIQEHSNWCWDASSQSILYYYQNYPTQCEIANWAWGRNDCCGNPVFYWDHPCNLPNSICVIRDIIDNYRDIYSDCLGDYLSERVVNYEADAHRPFGIRFGWKGGGGHILVGRGYSDGYVYYMDPWPGNGYTISTYAWVVDSPKHSWTHTVRVKNPGKPDLVAPSSTLTDHTPSYT